MRVLILGLNYSPEPSGNGPYTTGLAAGLAARGHSVTVRTGYPHYPTWSISEGYEGRRMSEQIDGVHIERFRHHIPDPLSPRDRARMEASFGVRSTLGRWSNPDVVLCVSPALISSALSIARVRSTFHRPAVGMWVQDLYGLGVSETGAAGDRTARLMARFESRALRSADGVATIHDRLRSHVVDHLGVPADRARVIRNWTHLKPLNLPPRDEARRALGWNTSETVILHAGNMGAKQGLENFVEAARLASETAPSLRFILLGDGNQRPQLEERARGLQNLTFIRPLPDEEFRLAMAAADILLVNERPDVAEMAVPSKLTSYFTTGKPVLAATDPNSVTAQEIATSGGGLQVAPGDPQALLAGALRLEGDSALSRTMGERGQAFCSETLSVQTAITQYEEWLQQLIAARRMNHRQRNR